MKSSLRIKSSFKQKVFAIVRKIPKGKTLTYKQVAKMASRPKAVRAVGNILNTNYDPKIPCHRVVHSDGKLAPAYAFGGKEVQRKILLDEGVQFVGDRVKMN